MAEKIMDTRLKIRGDTASNWSSVNPTLLKNEIGYDETNKKFKIGDGTTAWNSLPYANFAPSNSGVYYVEGTGTTAGTWTGSSSEITSYYDGLTILYKVNIAGASTTKLNINSLGAKTVYRYGTTKLTTQYPVNSVILVSYMADLNSGCWMVIGDYDANTYQRLYPTTSDIEYPITTRYNTTTGNNYYAEYGRYSTGVTLNPSKNTITATKFIGTATRAIADENGNNIASTYALKSEIPEENDVNLEPIKISGSIDWENGGSTLEFTEENYQQFLKNKTAHVVIDDAIYTLYSVNEGGGEYYYTYERIVLTANSKEIHKLSIGWNPIDYGYSDEQYIQEINTQVSYTPTLTEGTKIGTITIDGVNTDLYAPEGEGSTTESSFERVTESFIFNQEVINKGLFVAIDKGFTPEKGMQIRVLSMSESMGFLVGYDGDYLLIEEINYDASVLTYITSTDSLDIYEMPKSILETFLEKNESVELTPNTTYQNVYVVELKEIVNITSDNINDYLPEINIESELDAYFTPWVSAPKEFTVNIDKTYYIQIFESLTTAGQYIKLTEDTSNIPMHIVKTPDSIVVSVENSGDTIIDTLAIEQDNIYSFHFPLAMASATVILLDDTTRAQFVEYVSNPVNDTLTSHEMRISALESGSGSESASFVRKTESFNLTSYVLQESTLYIAIDKNLNVTKGDLFYPDQDQLLYIEYNGEEFILFESPTGYKEALEYYTDSGDLKIYKAPTSVLTSAYSVVGSYNITPNSNNNSLFYADFVDPAEHITSDNIDEYLAPLDTRITALENSSGSSGESVLNVDDLELSFGNNKSAIIGYDASLPFYSTNKIKITTVEGFIIYLNLCFKSSENINPDSGSVSFNANAYTPDGYKQFYFNLSGDTYSWVVFMPDM